MHYPFIDTDAQIEEIQQTTIAKIFEEQGEDYFRALETEIVKSTAHIDDAVIACGGGTPCFNDNIKWMRENGIVVYLKVPVPHLFTRLKTRASKRPLIAGLEDEQLMHYINEKIAEREIYYAQAHQVVDPTAVKPKFVADLLMKKGNKDKSV